MKAIQSLAARWKERVDVKELLANLLNDPSYHIRQLVVRLLGEVGDLQICDRLKSFSEHETEIRLVRSVGEAIKQIHQRYAEQK